MACMWSRIRNGNLTEAVEATAARFEETVSVGVATLSPALLRTRESRRENFSCFRIMRISFNNQPLPEVNSVDTSAYAEPSNPAHTHKQA